MGTSHSRHLEIHNHGNLCEKQLSDYLKWIDSFNGEETISPSRERDKTLGRCNRDSGTSDSTETLSSTEKTASIDNVRGRKQSKRKRKKRSKLGCFRGNSDTEDSSVVETGGGIEEHCADETTCQLSAVNKSTEQLNECNSKASIDCVDEICKLKKELIEQKGFNQALENKVCDLREEIDHVKLVLKTDLMDDLCVQIEDTVKVQIRNIVSSLIKEQVNNDEEKPMKLTKHEDMTESDKGKRFEEQQTKHIKHKKNMSDSDTDSEPEAENSGQEVPHQQRQQGAYDGRTIQAPHIPAGESMLDHAANTKPITDMSGKQTVAVPQFTEKKKSAGMDNDLGRKQHQRKKKRCKNIGNSDTEDLTPETSGGIEEPCTDKTCQLSAPSESSEQSNELINNRPKAKNAGQQFPNQKQTAYDGQTIQAPHVPAGESMLDHAATSNPSTDGSGKTSTVCQFTENDLTTLMDQEHLNTDEINKDDSKKTFFSDLELPVQTNDEMLSDLKFPEPTLRNDEETHAKDINKHKPKLELTANQSFSSGYPMTTQTDKGFDSLNSPPSSPDSHVVRRKYLNSYESNQSNKNTNSSEDVFSSDCKQAGLSEHIDGLGSRQRVLDESSSDAGVKCSISAFASVDLGPIVSFTPAGSFVDDHGDAAMNQNQLESNSSDNEQITDSGFEEVTGAERTQLHSEGISEGLDKRDNNDDTLNLDKHSLSSACVKAAETRTIVTKEEDTCTFSDRQTDSDNSRKATVRCVVNNDEVILSESEQTHTDEYREETGANADKNEDTEKPIDHPEIGGASIEPDTCFKNVIDGIIGDEEEGTSTKTINVEPKESVILDSNQNTGDSNQKMTGIQLNSGKVVCLMERKMQLSSSGVDSGKSGVPNCSYDSHTKRIRITSECDSNCESHMSNKTAMKQQEPHGNLVNKPTCINFENSTQHTSSLPENTSKPAMRRKRLPSVDSGVGSSGASVNSDQETEMNEVETLKSWPSCSQTCAQPFQRKTYVPVYSVTQTPVLLQWFRHMINTVEYPVTNLPKPRLSKSDVSSLLMSGVHKEEQSSTHRLSFQQHMVGFHLLFYLYYLQFIITNYLTFMADYAIR